MEKDCDERHNSMMNEKNVMNDQRLVVGEITMMNDPNIVMIKP